jgi:hypothetical protein
MLQSCRLAAAAEDLRDIYRFVASGPTNQTALAQFQRDPQRAVPVCETIWLHGLIIKNIVFVLPVPESRIRRIMGFPDFRESEENPGKP